MVYFFFLRRFFLGVLRVFKFLEGNKGIEVFWFWGYLWENFKFEIIG